MHSIVASLADRKSICSATHYNMARGHQFVTSTRR